MTASAPAELLDWDTRFFGFRVARLKGDTLTPALAAAAEEWCLANVIRCLYFMARADEPQTTLLAEKHGYRLVDVRLDFIHPGGAPDAAPEAAIRPAQPGDLPALEAIAGQIYGDTRFYYDPNFDPRKCDELYRTWIRVSCEGYAAAVLVADLDGAVAGYVTCHLDVADHSGRIGLVGVHPQAHGRGLGQALVRAALTWFAGQGAQPVSVATQGRNIAAQRLYQRCGFLSRAIYLWYHRWFPVEDFHEPVPDSL